MNPVEVAFSDTHLSFQSHKDGRDLFFSDKAPFDAMGKGSNGGSSRVWGSVILHKTTYTDKIIF